MAVYDAQFFEARSQGTATSARRLLPAVLDLVRPATAIDVGCGTGAWTRELLERGVDALGVDGDYVDRASLAIPVGRFVARDLARELGVERRFDLALSLEVAEHLPPARAAPFVAELAALAPAVLFSAAIPHQGGTGHVNERWQSYWRDLFATHGYAPYDAVRRFWDDPAIDPWYLQNAILYVEESTARTLGLQLTPTPLDVVHPVLYRWQNERRNRRRSRLRRRRR